MTDATQQDRGPPTFTPGPWTQGERFTGRILAGKKGSYRGFVATACQYPDDENSPSELELANARIIAAAPDLLEALQELADLMQAVIDGEYNPDCFTLQPARAAIARATTPDPAPESGEA